ncbi:MAG: hypothetical protein KOO60_02835 [Gemmatimonadales bacterium]|nr:hypothetical protein [Gemmatimonadales bacterium]
MLTLAVVVVVAIAGPSSASDSLSNYADRLNIRIELAVADGREWPNYPGGLAGFLFGAVSAVERGSIYFQRAMDADGGGSRWYEATIYEKSDGTWRIVSIGECEDWRVAEAVELRDRVRRGAIKYQKFDYVAEGPLELLELLKTWSSPNWTAPIIPFGWVKESDLPALMGLLDSTEPCANVQNPISSFIDSTQSTVGNEAAYLIEGFRNDRYPPRLNSTRPFCDIGETKQWWEERKGT